MLFRYRLFTSGLALISFGCAVPAPPIQDISPRRMERHLMQVPGGPPTISGCYFTESSFYRVKLTSFFVTTDSRTEWEQIARNVPRTCDMTEVWDDKWYLVNLPDNQVKNLMMVWKDTLNGNYGYVVVKNTPDKWLLYSSDGTNSFWLKNGEMKKFTWFPREKQIDIDVRNPHDSEGTTSNDIQVGWGFPTGQSIEHSPPGEILPPKLFVVDNASKSVPRMGFMNNIISLTTTGELGVTTTVTSYKMIGFTNYIANFRFVGRDGSEVHSIVKKLRTCGYIELGCRSAFTEKWEDKVPDDKMKLVSKVVVDISIEPD